MPIIKISKYATGSWPKNIGDTTLFYSGDSSRHAKDVEGFFLDNPPRLSPDCAGLVWRYYQDTDRYLLIHVQGSQVVNAALGRNYPFRAGYEVSRDDMNAIKFNIPAVLKAVPRIANMQGDRVPLETEVDDKTRWPKGEETLKNNILNAFYRGQKLYIALDVPGRKYHEDGIFDAPELKMLLGAIHQMPEDVQRYMWFAFCVDSNYDYVLDDVPIVVYLAGRNINAADGVKTSWEEVTTESLFKGNNPQPFNFTLPGKNELLMPFSELRSAAVVAAKKVDELDGEEWQMWLKTDHDLSELNTNSWEDFARFVKCMDEKTRSEYIDSVRAASLKWELAGLREDLYGLMDYDERRKSALRCKSEVLKDMLQGGSTYRFLYPKGQLTADALRAVDAKFLEGLNLQRKEEIKEWCRIFEKNGCLDNEEVKKTFAMLFEKHIFRSLYSTDEVLECMREYPFIPGKKYQKPTNFTPPTKKQLAGIKTEYRKVVEKWVKQEAENFSFDRIEDVMDSLRNAKKLNEVEKKALEDISKERVVQLLTESTQGRKSRDNSTLDACEDFLAAVASLPYLSQSWQEKAEETFLPAVGEVIKSIGEFSKDNLLDVARWAGLGRMLKKYPGVFLFVKKQMETQINYSNNTELKEDVIRHFFIGEEETSEHQPDSNNVHFEVVIPGGGEGADEVITMDGNEAPTANAPLAHDKYSAPMRKGKRAGGNEKARKFRDEDEAEKAYPLIETFIKILDKMNMKKDVKDLRIQFKDLKSVKDKNTKYLKHYLTLGLCFFVGLVVSVLMMWPFMGSSGEEPSKPSGTHILQTQTPVAAKHPMLQLADSLTAGKGLLIRDFVCADEKFDTLRLDSLPTLLPISKAYAQRTSGVGAATAYLNIKGEDGKEKKDSVVINVGNTLLQATNQKGCRIDKIVIGSVTVDIPKELADNDTIDMTNPYYYFRVINHIGKSISNELSLTVAY